MSPSQPSRLYLFDGDADDPDDADDDGDDDDDDDEDEEEKQVLDTTSVRQSLSPI